MFCWKCVARKCGFVYLRFNPLRRNSLKAWLQSILSVDSWIMSLYHQFILLFTIETHKEIDNTVSLSV